MTFMATKCKHKIMTFEQMTNVFFSGTEEREEHKENLKRERAHK